MRVFIKDLKSGAQNELSVDKKIEVKDDSTYQILVEIDEFEEGITPLPSVSLGDISLSLSEGESMLGSTLFKTQDKGSFFDKAIFLNYFGECELRVTFENVQQSFLFDVNITSHKAKIAYDIVNYLSKNSEDILQSCYSKSRSGYDYKNGAPNKVVKFKALEAAINQLELAIHKLRFNKKHDIRPSVEFHSSKPPSFSDRVNEWLFENVDEVTTADSENYSFKLNRQFLKVDLPNSINLIDTDKDENHVLHHFVRTAEKYLRQELEDFKSNYMTASQLDTEYEGYVKFDNVIKSSIKSIYASKEKTVWGLLSKLKNIQFQINKYIPVKKVKAVMPIQTSYTLRHKHYSNTFEAIKIFYLAESADKHNESFLLGLRSLSQLFEFACLYYLVNYLKSFSQLNEVSWMLDSHKFIGEKKKHINILGNCFEFENDSYKYTLLYEKKFYALSKSTHIEQLNNLIRVDRGASYFEPDFTLKIENKITGEYYFIILDAKFSRRYKMFDKAKEDNIGILSSIYLKYGNGLKAYTSAGVENLTTFIGVMFGLKTDSDNTNRLTYFDRQFDLDGQLPISPFASADFIDFSNGQNEYYKVLDKYIKKQ